SYGSNAFGIEEAAKTFFGKTSKEIGVLESSILASIPKGPTYYSPYNHADRLMGYIYVYKEATPKDIIKVAETENPSFYKPLSDKLKSIFTDAEIKKTGDTTVNICKLDKAYFKPNIKIDSAGCINIDTSKLMELLNSIIIPYDSLSIENPNADLSGYIMEFNTGRKDFVLGRMLEDDKIKPEDYKKALVQALDFKFKKYTENIKYPHFVFYVKEYLEDNFGKDFGAQGGLKIYTTIDPKLQDKAEELVKKQVAVNKKLYGAGNAALISIDNRNGQIIAMVGGADYFDESKGSNVNIITSLKQPGSSFKPIVYANAISREPVGPDTPVYDSETKFGKWEPDNYDSKFMGLMPIKKALDYSRNIPAIKMFFFGGGEDIIVKFANSLGIASLKLGASYGGPLAIGTGELKPLELAQAYSVFANMGKKKNISPIIKIEDKKGNLIYQNRESEGKQIFSDAASYIISKILSDASSRPNQYWNNVLTLKDRAVAAKTGTSNKDVSVGDKKMILPGDLWTAGYTAQITTVVWAGNTDGSPTKGTCDGLNCAAPIWHDFMEFAHIGLPKLDFKEPESVIKATISKASGKLAGNSTPNELKVSSIFAVKPTEYDSGYKSIQVDSLCNGLVTDSTPKEAIKTIYYGGSLSPIIDSYNSDWLKSIGKYSLISGGESAGSGTTVPCERPSGDYAGISLASSLVNGANYDAGPKTIDIRFDSNNPVIKIVLTMDGETIKTFPIDELKNSNLEGNLNITEGQHKIVITAVDKFYFSAKATYIINPNGEIIPDDNSGTVSNTGVSSSIESPKTDSKPIITTTNPIEGDTTLQLYKDQTANVRGKVSDSLNIDVINVYLNGKLFKILDGGNSFVVPLNDTKDFEAGTYSVKIEAINSSGKSGIKILELKILER
ncbi:MAG: penicillin-binding transpeptidase domain-containing protein, partial [Candidatus Gracilibacteria bacterium]|nr:penicillin-binding transpeptidase domain-containing protein [Candidatus Gracilibacteria bacterium]